MNNTELAYVAGIVEADGSIGINRWKGAYKVVVQVSMRKAFIPEWLKLKVGGTLVRYMERGKPSHKWMVTSHKAKELCSSMLPYLVEKRSQAKIALLFPINERGEKFTEEGNELRNTLWEVMREANKGVQ